MTEPMGARAEAHRLPRRPSPPTARSLFAGGPVLRAGVVLLAGVGLLVGCGGEGTHEATLRTQLDTLDGVVLVSNAGEPPVWSLELAFELGLPGGGGEPDPREFGRVHGMALAPDGQVWIGDVQAREVRHFGPDGSFLGAFGRAGQGPGEMASLQSLAWLGRDTLAILDSAQGRVLLYSPAGVQLGQHGYPAGITGPPRSLRFHPVSLSRAYAMSPLEVDGRAFVEYSAAGRGGTLPWRRTEDMPSSSTVCPLPDGAPGFSPGSIRFFEQPYAPAAIRQPLPGGQVLEVRSDTLRLTFVDAEGQVARVAEDALPAVPVTDEDWAEATADYRAFREESPGVRCESEPVRPRVKPPLVDAHVDMEGRIWAEVRTPDGPAFRVYEASGEWAGRLLAQVPAAALGPDPSIAVHTRRIPPAFAPGWVALLGEGALGEDVVRVYRVREG
jgi:hypothetical protein